MTPSFFKNAMEISRARRDSSSSFFFFP